uniref:G protein-coupled receptor n=1 Tax=Heligmosomoides polygyrus TaxID=6339 RepID=A0A183FVR5_HELPZ
LTYIKRKRVILYISHYLSQRQKSSLPYKAQLISTRRPYFHFLIAFSVAIQCFPHFQIISPALFLHVPLVCIYVLLFTGVSSPWEMSYGIGFLMSFYPLSCPIIIVVFVKDYRNFILSLLRMGKPSVNPVSAAVHGGEPPGSTHLNHVVSHSYTK